MTTIESKLNTVSGKNEQELSLRENEPEKKESADFFELYESFSETEALAEENVKMVRKETAEFIQTLSERGATPEEQRQALDALSEKDTEIKTLGDVLKEKMENTAIESSVGKRLLLWKIARKYYWENFATKRDELKIGGIVISSTSELNSDDEDKVRAVDIVHDMELLRKIGDPVQQEHRISDMSQILPHEIRLQDGNMDSMTASKIHSAIGSVLRQKVRLLEREDNMEEVIKIADAIVDKDGRFIVQKDEYGRDTFRYQASPQLFSSVAEKLIPLIKNEGLPIPKFFNGIRNYFEKGDDWPPQIAFAINDLYSDNEDYDKDITEKVMASVKDYRGVRASVPKEYQIPFAEIVSKKIDTEKLKDWIRISSNNESLENSKDFEDAVHTVFPNLVFGKVYNEESESRAVLLTLALGKLRNLAENPNACDEAVVFLGLVMDSFPESLLHNQSGFVFFEDAEKIYAQYENVHSGDVVDIPRPLKEIRVAMASGKLRPLTSDEIDFFARMNIPFSEEERAILDLYKNRILKSPSMTVRNLAPEFLESFRQQNAFHSREEMERALSKIEDIFLKNNIPMVGKQFQVFQILHPDFSKLNENSSPEMLSLHGDNARRELVFLDLMRISFETLNENTEQYLQAFADGNSALGKYESNAELSKEEMGTLRLFFKKINALSINVGRPGLETAPSDRIDITDEIQKLRKSFGVRPGESVSDKFSTTFLNRIGIENVGEAVKKFETLRSDADVRNREFAEKGKIELHRGDILKGVSSQFFNQQMEFGYLAPEFLGADTREEKNASIDSDSTPYDTDVIVWNKDSDVSSLTPVFSKNSVVNEYGDITLIIGNRGQFKETEKDKQVDRKDTRPELFRSGILGEDHYGIRTGFGSTEISAIISKDTSEKMLDPLKFSIAKKGFYIPIVNKIGKVIFSEKEFDSLREKFFWYSDKEKTKGLEVSLKEILARPEHTPSDIVDLFQSKSQELWNMDVGVGEGYSLREHTLMMMGQFRKYFFDKFSGSVDRNFMEVVFALHDAGKPLAVAQGDIHKQHEYTNETLHGILPTLGYSEREVDIATALVGGDPLGEYLSGKEGVVGAEEAALAIRQMAKKTDLPKAEFWNLLQTFYLSDAGSYTQDAGGKRSLDDLFVFDKKGANLSLAAPYAEKINELERLVLSD